MSTLQLAETVLGATDTSEEKLDMVSGSWKFQSLTVLAGNGKEYSNEVK